MSHGNVVGIVEAYFDEKGADVSDKFFARNSASPIAGRSEDEPRPDGHPSSLPRHFSGTINVAAATFIVPGCACR